MLKKLIKLITFVAISVIIIVQSSIQVFGADNSGVYNYNSWGDTENVPSGYSFTATIGNDVKAIFNNPMDMYYSGEYLYVLDSGNARVVIFDNNYNYVREIKDFFTVKNNTREESPLNAPSGIFVCHDGRLLIADTGNARVVVCKPDGEIVTNLVKPDSEIYPQELDFNPVKVVMDDLDNIYVLAKGFYYGAVIYNKNGDNTGFFGANKVKVSASLLSDMFWRQFMTNKQLSYTKNYLPTAFSSLDIDKNNFIYTCTGDSDDAIRKLNFLGENIFKPEQGPDPLDKSIYGDREKQIYNGVTYSTTLCDIAVSDSDFVYVLDSTKGRVFEYDQDSNLLNIFGAKGSQKGTFVTPVAIETIGNNVLVLDQDKAQICVFSTTDYGVLLHEATTLYHQGLFDKAYEKWEDVLKLNANSELAYKGLGRANLQSDNYKSAMYYARLGQDRSGYSKAFRLYRSEVAKEYFAWCVLALAVLIIIIKIIKKRFGVSDKHFNKRKCDKDKMSIKEIFVRPLILFERLFDSKSRQPLIVSAIIVFLFFVGQVVNTLATGFIFNQNNIGKFNIFFLLAQSVGIVCLWTVSDMIVGSLRFGHGTIRRVFTGTAVALVPYTAAIYINVVLSQFLTYEEKSIMTVVSAIGIIYTIFLLYQSVRIMQRYRVGEAFVSIVLDIFAAIIIMLLLIVVFMLIRQLYIFFQTVFNEIMYRIN